MTERGAQSHSGILGLAQRVEREAGVDGIPPQIRLYQALERLIVSSPKKALEIIEQNLDEIANLTAAGALGNLLVRVLTEKLLYHEAAEVIQSPISSRLINDVSIMTNLAKRLIQQGHIAEAKRVLETALSMDSACVPAIKALYECELKAGQVPEAEKQLDRLAVLDGSYNMASYVYKERLKLPLTQERNVRVAVLSSYVLDWLLPFLDGECRHAGLTPHLYLAPFNQYTQEILHPTSELYRFRPEIVFLALAIEDLFPAVLTLPKDEELHEARSAIISHLLSLVRQLGASSGAVIVVHEFSLGNRLGYGILDNRVPNGLSPWVASLNLALADALKNQERTYLLPLESVIGWVGKEHSHNCKMFYMGSMRIATPALPSLARYYMRYIKPLKGLTRKCVILDLDGTLWGGIVGEVGLEGISLGPSAPGIEYVDFQRALLNLLRRGVLLAICSKNNLEDALSVVRTHPHMVLREEHFASMRINWQNKADNIREIALELNIGLDSLVFMDDNPHERELVKQLLPEVLTVELPKDASLYRKTLEEMSDFELLALTKEDEMRVVQYQANTRRQVAKSSAASLEEYLCSLHLEVFIGVASREARTRLVQLFNKTNQFNLTTKRYQVNDVAQFMDSTNVVVYDLHVRDRFGDHGLVGTAVVRKEGAAWRIDSLLISCRVMGMEVETAFLERICSDAVRGNAKTLIGEFVPTNKNMPAKDFYKQHGFSLVRELEARQEWGLTLERSNINRARWIGLNEKG